MKKNICIFLIILMIVTPALTQQSSDYLTGKADGARDGASAASPLWIVAGIGCGVFGVGAAYLMPPSPPAEKLIGKSPEYVAGYTESYRNSARNRQTLYACAGWLSWVLIYLAILSSQPTY